MVFKMVFFDNGFSGTGVGAFVVWSCLEPVFFTQLPQFKKIGFNVLSLAAEKLEARKEHNLTKRTA
jgi:hypothetical protein